LCYCYHLIGKIQIYYNVITRTTLSVILLLNVGHKSTGSFSHLADVVVVGAVSGADGPAVDSVSVAVARLQTLTARHKSVDRRHAVSAETAPLPVARVSNICRIDIATGGRADEEAGGERQKQGGGQRRRDDRGGRR